MKKSLIQLILILIIFSPEIFPQRLWDIYKVSSETIGDLGQDTSIVTLQNIILDNSSDGYLYKSAAIYLAYFHESTQRQFLLDNLNTSINEWLNEKDSSEKWYKYETDQLIRGYLGDQSSIAGMDTIAQFDDSVTERLFAINKLAELGFYNYFDYIINLFNNDSDRKEIIITILGEYGKSDIYKNEISTLLENEIRSSSDGWQILRSALSLASFNNELAILILNELFEQSSGQKQFDIFIDLNIFDPDGQPERSILALSNEQDEHIRSNYLPSLNQIISGAKSKRYLEPNFISFISGLLQRETSPFVANDIRQMLNKFYPIQPFEQIYADEMLDTLYSYSNLCYNFNWIGDESYKNELIDLIQSAKDYLSVEDSVNCAKQIKSFKESVESTYADSAGNYPKYVGEYGHRYLYYFSQYILDRLPEIPEDTTPEVRLLKSSGSPLTGGVCQYYEGGWKTATDNGDGTFAIETNLTTLSIRMTYAYGTQTLSNVPWGTGPVVFQTVNTQVQLKDSEDNFIDEGTVKYYAGGWRDFGVTENGIAKKELLPVNYSFRMTYAYASKDKQQDLSADPVVVFHTVPATVQLKNSQGNLIDEGTVKYYSGGWRDFGTTSNGVATLELLPNNYSFRMTYAFASNDKQQNIGDDSTVIFQTVPVTVQLKNSLGEFIDQGTVQYYSGGWRNFGTTTNGIATLELLPNNYSFRMTYAYSSNDKQQNIGTDPTVIFQTVPATVQLKNSSGDFMPAPMGDQGTVQYYSGGWRNFGTTTNGVATLELLPNSYSFRMTHEFISSDKTQNIGTDNIIDFTTVNNIVRVTNTQGQPVDNAAISYYSGGWRQIGTTVKGEITKELLPKNLTFRAAYGGTSQDKTQDTETNNLIEFTIVE